MVKSKCLMLKYHFFASEVPSFDDEIHPFWWFHTILSRQRLHSRTSKRCSAASRPLCCWATSWGAETGPENPLQMELLMGKSWEIRTILEVNGGFNGMMIFLGFLSAMFRLPEGYFAGTAGIDIGWFDKMELQNSVLCHHFPHFSQHSLGYPIFRHNHIIPYSHSGKNHTALILFHQHVNHRIVYFFSWGFIQQNFQDHLQHHPGSWW